MKHRLATVLSVAALALTACGEGEEQSPGQGSQPPGGGAPPAEQPRQTPPPAQPADDQPGPEELVRESEAVAATVVEAARRLAEDPKADVSEELARAEERARALAAQAQQPVQEGREQGQDLAEQGRQALEPEGRQALVELNQRTAAAAQRLRGAAGEPSIGQIARDELGRLRGDLDSTLDRLRDAVPPDVRDRVDQLQDRLRGLAP